LNKNRIFTAIQNFHRKKIFMAETKVMRLTKAAREFNVGRETIVEFLEKKGFEIDVNPNTKLSPEMVDLLADEFSSEKSVKEEARKKGLGSMKRETISLEDRKKPDPTEDDTDDEQDIIIRGMSVEVDEDFKRAVEPHHEKQKTKEKEPAEKPSVKEEPETKKLAPDDAKPAVEEKPAKVPEESAPEAPKAKTETSEEISEKPELTKPEEEKAKPTAQADEKKTEKTKEPPIKEKTAPAEQKEMPEKEEPVDTDQKKTIAKQEEKGEDIAPEKPKEEATTEPKVIGKIDLSSINERTKPPRKSAAEKRKEREEKKKAEAASKKEPKPVKPKEQTMEPVAEKTTEEPKAAQKEPKAEEKPKEE
jgi:translation initiation factor IF-2